MAVLVTLTGSVSKSQYEALRKEVRWESQQPKGGIVHAAAFDDSDQLHAADVWESPEVMNAFVERNLMPAFEKLGISPPEVAVYPLHNLNAYESIEDYRI